MITLIFLVGPLLLSNGFSTELAREYTLETETGKIIFCHSHDESGSFSLICSDSGEGYLLSFQNESWTGFKLRRSGVPTFVRILAPPKYFSDTQRMTKNRPHCNDRESRLEQVAEEVRLFSYPKTGALSEKTLNSPIRVPGPHVALGRNRPLLNLINDQWINADDRIKTLVNESIALLKTQKDWNHKTTPEQINSIWKVVSQVAQEKGWNEREKPDFETLLKVAFAVGYSADASGNFAVPMHNGSNDKTFHFFLNAMLASQGEVFSNLTTRFVGVLKESLFDTEYEKQDLEYNIWGKYFGSQSTPSVSRLNEPADYRKGNREKKLQRELEIQSQIGTKIHSVKDFVDDLAKYLP